MKFNRYLIASFMIFFGLDVQAQEKKADDAFYHHHYEEAIELYNEVVRKDLDNDHAITNLGISYWKVDEPAQAEYWLTRAALMSENNEVKMWYAQLLMSSEKYEMAAKWFRKFATLETDDQLIRNSNQLASYCESIASGAIEPQRIKLKKISANSEDLDFAPRIYDGTLFFVTNRATVTTRVGVSDPWTAGNFTDVVKAKVNEKGELDEVVQAFEGLNSYYHEGPICFDKGMSELYMTKSDINERRRQFDELKNTRLKIVHYVKSQDGWEEMDDLPFYNKNYNCAHPTISEDGQWMVFSSDMNGGKGGMDIWYSQRQSDGNWGKAINAGDMINTKGSEVFPTIKDGELFFSSDLQVGLGGLDLFSIDWDKRMEERPTNMGVPFNSSRDDFAIDFEKDGESGYLSTNRYQKSGDDILYFEMEKGVVYRGAIVDCATGEPISGATIEVETTSGFKEVAFSGVDGKFWVNIPENENVKVQAMKEGFVDTENCSFSNEFTTSGLTNGDIIEHTVALREKDVSTIKQHHLCGDAVNAEFSTPLVNVVATFVNQSTGESIEVSTDENGGFFIPLVADDVYSVSAMKEGFLPYNAQFQVPEATADCFEYSIPMEFGTEKMVATTIVRPIAEKVIETVSEGDVLELYNVYFDYNSSKLTDQAKEAIDKICQLMEDHPSMKGEIMAHTDSRSTVEYNFELSQRRAQSVKDYMASQGVSVDRLMASGYGEMLLRNECISDADCTEEQHSRNRRVEFRITDFSSDIYWLSHEEKKYFNLQD